MAKTGIALEPEEARELNKRLRASKVSVRDRQRAQIILLAADGHTQENIGQRVGVTRVTVNHWCRRFVKARLAGLADAPGRGRKPSLPVAAVMIGSTPNPARSQSLFAASRCGLRTM